MKKWGSIESLKDLKQGETIKSKYSNDDLEYIITGIYLNYVRAVSVTDITNPAEWEKLETETQCADDTDKRVYINIYLPDNNFHININASSSANIGKIGNDLVEAIRAEGVGL